MNTKVFKTQRKKRDDNNDNPTKHKPSGQGIKKNMQRWKRLLPTPRIQRRMELQLRCMQQKRQSNLPSILRRRNNRSIKTQRIQTQIPSNTINRRTLQSRMLLIPRSIKTQFYIYIFFNEAIKHDKNKPN